MGTLTNSPQQHTMLRLEARMSFSLGIEVIDADTSAPINFVTNLTSGFFTLAQPKHKGGAVLLNKSLTASEAEAAEGLIKLHLQASELDLAAGEYPFTVSLRSAGGYSYPIVKGSVEILENTDPNQVGTIYTSSVPGTHLVAAIASSGRVTVKVDTGGWFPHLERRLRELEINGVPTGEDTANYAAIFEENLT